MRTILWNTCSKELEAMHSGRFYIFAPNEKREFDTDYQEDVIKHLLFRLEEKGLVQHPINETGLEVIKSAKVRGLKARLKLVDGIARNYATMNRERESCKMAPEAPSDYVYECIMEANAIREELVKIDDKEALKMKVASEYLAKSRTEDVKKELEEGVDRLEVTPTKVEIRKPLPK